MLRSLFARLGLTRNPGQLELTFDESLGALERLKRLGLRGMTRVTLTSNRSVYVSVRGTELRMHEAFAHAPDEILRAIVVFVCGRGVERRVARKAIVAYPVPRGESKPRARERLHPDDHPLAERLTAEHARLNVAHFQGVLRPMSVRVSRRMRTRLGHYTPALTHGTAEIVMSRRHLRRHGWDEVVDTLLHEMVHQWQDECGLSVDHGPGFRRKARDVGASPRAKRVVRSEG
jgi:hypothetical protein